MSVARKAGKAAIWLANSIVNLFVIVLVLLLVAFSCYALWDSGQVYNAASATVYETYKPTAEDEGESFAQLRAINPEVFSWLTVYGTHIDYPVTQSDENWKYVNTNAKGEYSMAGSIFLDAANAPDFSDFNSLLYGHHMDKDTMFGELGLFSEEAYFNERKYGNLYYDGGNHGLEFFAFLHADAYDTSVFAANIEGEDLQQQYLDNLLDKAIYERDIGISITDNIVLLTTCSSTSTNGRDIMVARVTDDLYEDTFITEEITNTGTGVDARPAGGFWKTIPLWGWILLAALPLLVLLLLVLTQIRKRQKRRAALQQRVLQRMNGGLLPGAPTQNDIENTKEREE